MNVRRRVPVGTVVFVLMQSLIQGCVSPVESCAATRQIMGTWKYAATQDAPVRASLTGSLVISTQSCVDFQGALDVTEVTADGRSRRIAGPVSGLLVDSVVARFDATLGGADRQHLARFGGDSVWGSWVEIESGASVSGSFSGRLTEPR
jgi:hypothetical protein